MSHVNVALDWVPGTEEKTLQRMVVQEARYLSPTFVFHCDDITYVRPNDRIKWYRVTK